MFRIFPREHRLLTLLLLKGLQNWTVVIVHVIGVFYFIVRFQGVVEVPPLRYYMQNQMNNYFVGSTEPHISQLDEIPELIVIPERNRGNFF